MIKGAPGLIESHHSFGNLDETYVNVREKLMLHKEQAFVHEQKTSFPSTNERDSLSQMFKGTTTLADIVYTGDTLTSGLFEDTQLII